MKVYVKEMLNESIITNRFIIDSIQPSTECSRVLNYYTTQIHRKRTCEEYELLLNLQH